MQNEPTSYFLSIATNNSLIELKSHYEDFKHLESTFEEIHNYLPNPAFFDYVIESYLTSYNKKEYIIEKLKQVESCVLIVLSKFSEEIKEVQNLFLDGFFTLHIFEIEKCEKIMAFIKEINESLHYLKTLTFQDLQDVYKIAHYHSYYPEDKIRSFDTYPYIGIDEYYMFDEHELFLHLFIDQINPVLLTDHFFKFKTPKDFEVLHLLINGVKDLNTPSIQLKLSEQEYELLRSENHPPFTIKQRHGYGITSAMYLVKSLISLNLPSEMIYRINYDTQFMSISSFQKDQNTLINEFIEFSNQQPTLREIFAFLKFHNDIPVDRKYPLFTRNEVRYLYKKEMSLYFKENLSVFSEYCQFCQSLSEAPTIHFEWIDNNQKPHFANYCSVCLEAKNFNYMSEFDDPFC